MLLWAFLYILIVHWYADFVLQTHWQATNKSKNNKALARHVLVYTMVLWIASNPLFDLTSQWLFFGTLNGVLHFWTDYWTSRWTARLYKKKDWHNFFVVVGFDQLIHQFTLGITLYYFKVIF